MGERRGKVQTVLGLIEPGALGPTLMHEHLVADLTPPDRRPEHGVEITLRNRWQMDYEWVTAPGNRRLMDVDVAVREMEQMRRDGGRSVVEVSIPPMLVDPVGLREVSRRAGVHVVRGTGRYIQEFIDEREGARAVDALAAEFIREIETGYADTGIHAGIIGEIGCSWPWSEPERRSVSAGVIAQRHTGAALSIHPGRNVASPFEIARLVRAEGGDMARTIIDHVERRLFRLDDMKRLADEGCVLEFDVFGWETSRFSQGLDASGGDLDLSSDGVRITAIRGLIDAGHLERIVIAHDICQRTRQMEYGGHGYGHIFRNIVPMMRRRGFSQAELDAILVANPARLLAFA